MHPAWLIGGENVPITQAGVVTISPAELSIESDEPLLAGVRSG